MRLSRSLRLCAVSALLLSLCAAFGAAQPDATAPAQPVAPQVEPASSDTVQRLRARLQSLDPEAPMAYFELAEDFTFELPDVEARRIARTLFVLAYELDRRARTPHGLGRSACLALAELAESPGEAQWLLEMARSFDPQPAAGAVPGLIGGREQELRTPSLRLAEAIGLGRNDEGTKVKARTAKPEVAALLPRAIRDLGTASRVLETAQTKPHCAGCGGRRFDVAIADGANASLAPCPVCLGNPGLRLSAADFLASLRVESQLLRAEHQFWSAQTLADQSAPLREPDPAELAEAFDADAERPYWRPSGDAGLDGSWVRAPPQSSARP